MKRGSGVCDRVYTPRELALRLVRHFNPRGVVLDPCRGEGAFDGPLVTDWCEIEEGRDFFSWGGHADWIIGNPPWSLFSDFNRHALERGDNVVWLYHLAGHLTKRRIKDATDRGFSLRQLVLVDTPPEPWPQSGFQVAAAHWSREKGPLIWEDWR